MESGFRGRPYDNKQAVSGNLEGSLWKSFLCQMTPSLPPISQSFPEDPYSEWNSSSVCNVTNQKYSWTLQIVSLKLSLLSTWIRVTSVRSRPSISILCIVPCLRCFVPYPNYLGVPCLPGYSFWTFCPQVHPIFSHSKIQWSRWIRLGKLRRLHFQTCISLQFIHFSHGTLFSFESRALKRVSL